MSSEPVLSPPPGVRVPVQKRSRKRYEEVLDAAEKRFASDGIEATSMALVAADAGTSIGTLYGRFEDKNALVYAVHARYMERSLGLAEMASDPANWKGQDLEAVVTAVVPAMVASFRGNAGILRAFAYAGVRDEVLRGRAEAALRHGGALFSRLLEERRDEIAHPDPAAAADFAARLVLGMANHSLLFERPTERDYSDEELTAEITRAVLGYLRG
jgi:AcrR family transcriptional regulator